MADFIFNIGKGAFAEKARDDATKFGVILLKVAESDSLMKDRATVTDILTGNTEADFLNYARKTAITATLTVDNTNDRVDLDMPDQTFSSAGEVGGPIGTAHNNTLAKLVVFYDQSGSDATRIPISAHDFVVTTDGTDLTAVPATSGFARAS